MVVTIIALVDDLMFLSRIREAAGVGAEIKTVRNASALIEACRAGHALVLADLDSERLRSADAIRALRADPAGGAVTVIGFFSHVNTAIADEAKAAGATRVMPRGAFVRELGALVAAATRPE